MRIKRISTWFCMSQQHSGAACPSNTAFRPCRTQAALVHEFSTMRLTSGRRPSQQQYYPVAVLLEQHIESAEHRQGSWEHILGNLQGLWIEDPPSLTAELSIKMQAFREATCGKGEVLFNVVLTPAAHVCKHAVPPPTTAVVGNHSGGNFLLTAPTRQTPPSS